MNALDRSPTANAAHPQVPRVAGHDGSLGHDGGPMQCDWRAWGRRHLWPSPAQALLSLALLALLLWPLAELLDWAVVHAVWQADAERCQAMRGIGACWGVIAEKHRLILFGRYPHAEQWRPALATALLIALLVASGLPRCWRRGLVWAWLGAGLLFFVLMHGGAFAGLPTGLTPVSTDQWGGLPLTLMLTTLGLGLSFPLAVLLALGRRSELPAVRSLCAAYIELVRGVPLISVLFMASFMLPLLLPLGSAPDVLLRVLVGLTLFSAAYTAEVIRGGLQGLSAGQTDAARALGLNYWQTQRHIVLPQALAHVLPGLVNNAIALFKDTSLVTIVSLYELSGALGLAINADPDWRPFKIEGYLFIALIYFAFCFALSRYGLWVERRLGRVTKEK